jgi:hypothetical protein
VTECRHWNVFPTPKVAANGLLTGEVTVKCRDCKKVVFETTKKFPTGQGNFLVPKDDK